MTGSGSGGTGYDGSDGGLSTLVVVEMLTTMVVIGYRLPWW